MPTEANKVPELAEAVQSSRFGLVPQLAVPKSDLASGLFINWVRELIWVKISGKMRIELLNKDHGSIRVLRLRKEGHCAKENHFHPGQCQAR